MAPLAPERPEPRAISAVMREGGIALLVIAGIALLARLFHLGSGYWIDEIYAVQGSFRLAFGDIVTTFPGDNHHPLYSLAGRGTLVLFGESPWALRLPAAIFGVLTVPATYLVARLALARREALLASLLLATSYHHVWFSQNARGYTLIALLALLGTWALVRMLETGSWRMAFTFAAIAGLGVYTHMTMVFITIAHAVVAAIALVVPEQGQPRISWKVPVTAFLLGAALATVLYAPMIGQVLDFFLRNPSQLRGVSTPMWALREALRVLLLGVGAPGAIVAAVVLAGGAAIGIAGFASILQRRRNLALAFAIPPVVMLAGALAGRGTMYPRFFFFAAGMAIIVLVRGLFATGEAASRWRLPVAGPVIGTVLAGALVVASAASLSFNYRFPKQDFAGAMEYVLRSKANGDAVGFAGVPGDPYRTIYGQDWPTVDSMADLDALRGRGRTWLIYTFPRYLARGAPEVASVVEQDCEQRAVFRGTVGGGDLIVCTLEPS